MTTLKRSLAFAGLAALLPAAGFAASAQLTLTASNPLDFARPSQTIELAAAQLASLAAKNLNLIHVRDGAGKELVCQAVDNDGDYTPDQVIFQADFAAGEKKTFTVSIGGKQGYTKEQFRAYGRFVRERFDDFAWENDRVAYRTYGPALETWKGDPLTSSTVDIWSKRTPRLVINDWYLTDNYHADSGEGADFYSAGPSRGCGGNGLWAADKLWVSKNFVQSRVLANGPLRVMFELTYESFDVNGTKVAEVKRVTLDAGQNFNHFQSRYTPAAPTPLTTGIGIKKADVAEQQTDAARGWLAVWQPVKGRAAGSQGIAVVVDPKQFERVSADALNLLVLARVPAGNVAAYWAGFAWDKSGQCGEFAAWRKAVDDFAQGLAAPIQVSVSGR